MLQNVLRRVVNTPTRLCPFAGVACAIIASTTQWTQVAEWARRRHESHVAARGHRCDGPVAACALREHALITDGIAE
jgi:hypothetical protein